MSDLAVKPHWCTPWPTIEQGYLLQALFGPQADALDRYKAWRGATDLDGAVDFATYRLLSLLEARLRALGFEDDFTGRLKGIYRRAWFENNLMFQEVAEVVRRLGDAGIETMLLKGAPLAMLYYPEHAARPMSDIDLVVHEPDVARAAAIIAAMPGWDRKGRGEPDMDRLYKHSIAFAGDRKEIDLHWYFLREARSAAADRWLWRGALPFDFRGAATLRPSPTALLLSVIVHGIRCNPVSPVRWIADAVQVLRRDPGGIDWDDVVAFARRQRLSRRLGLGLRYLRDNFALPIPPEVPERLLAARVGVVERIENGLYLADPGAYSESRPARLSRMIANYVTVVGARTGLGLAARLTVSGPHFWRYRRDMRLHYRQASAARSH